MTDVVFLFDMHQPRRFRRQLGRSAQYDMRGLAEEIYFDDNLNRDILDRVARRAYIPALRSIAKSIKEDGFRCALGVSGVLMEQCAWWSQEVLRTVGDLAKTGACELIAEPYYRTIAGTFDTKEMAEQVDWHRKTISATFGVTPAVVANTDLIYNNQIASELSAMGFKGVMAEGVETALTWRSPNYVYKAKGSEVPLLMRNGILSDDIGFRFSSEGWPEYPLTAEKYADWLSKVEGDIVFIALDMAAFGEHHWPESGIHSFLAGLPKEVAKHENLHFATPSEVLGRLAPAGEVDVEESATMSWADPQKDTSAWLGNEMQRYCLDVARYVQPVARRLGDKYLRVWRLLTMSDHFYYMGTKGDESGGAHAYFSPYNSPVEMFLSFNWVLTDYRYRVYAATGDSVSYFRMLDGRLPDGHTFRFYSGIASPEGTAVRNLRELLEAIKVIGPKALEFHAIRGDLSRWVGEVLGCGSLALWLDSLRQKPLPENLRDAVIAEVEKTVKDAEVRLSPKEKAGLETR